VLAVHRQVIVNAGQVASSTGYRGAEMLVPLTHGHVGVGVVALASATAASVTITGYCATPDIWGGYPALGYPVKAYLNSGCAVCAQTRVVIASGRWRVVSRC
jgi:hypothetical protein